MCCAVPFHGWEASDTVLLWRTKPSGAWRGPEQDSLGKVFVHSVLQRLKSVFTQIQEPLAPGKNKQGCRWVTKPTYLFVISSFKNLN